MRSLTLLVASTLTVLAGAALAPALPQIAARFADQPHATFLVKLLLTMPAFFAALGSSVAGVIIDRYGRVRPLAIAIGVYGVAGGAGLVLDTLPHLLASRAVLGLATGTILTCCTTLIADYYEGHERNRFMGLQVSATATGGVIYLLSAGVLSDLGWRYPFAMYLGALPLVIAVPWFLSDVHSRTFASTNPSPDEPFPRGLTLRLYALGFITMVMFYTIPVQLPFYLRELVGATGTQAGFALAGLTLLAAVTASQYARIRRRLDYRGVFMLIYSAGAVGYFLLATAPGYSQIMLGCAVSGAGLGMLLPNLNVWINDALPAAYRGRVMGGLGFNLYLGQALSPVLNQPAIARWGFGGAYGTMAATAAVLAVLFAVLTWRRRGRE